MKPIAIIQHVANDGPSYFATWLDQHGLPYQVCRIDLGQPLPADIRAHAGLCILGGPMSANDALPYIEPLLALVRQAVALDVPVIGHCLGGQLLARALGAGVGAAAHPEIGWSDVLPTSDRAAAWFGSVMPLHLFQWHSESFDIPSGAVQLLKGRYCHHQAFVVNDKHLGMQFHCEVDEPKVLEWLDSGAAEMAASTSPAVQQDVTIRATLQQDLVNSQRIASRIYQRWVDGMKS
jgi:GMP synthase-like glutamine amidotransferase